MTELVKVGFLGIAGVLLAVQFRGSKPEYASYIGLAVSIIIFCFSMRQMETITGQFMKIRSYLSGSEEYLSILFRVIGITYICEFSSDICRDAGYQAVAGQIEVLGKLVVMFAGLPILFAVIEQIQSFL
ncbi:SpoIIIAC/SpoIIIAD family protein [uncultured Acetatifactor sp.]|jgi:stage III sporulation protein AD|uniref:SpoIIIAC/SpoIIIAD family protein n=1 Tax=uncultured Acetatifactor sp. TaxID=1671927 RepID=UPI0025D474B9|nr:SpoIIIAC/SpoIIIAD family protein [uncultured Acetatifactor sp.]MCI9231018.1 stage III sporulation protein AD [Lachnospiraceae bacterium]MCI9573491.1 stage III sporulation protein AD [Lachnospiraceae bacterium]